jgi:hypothetical protein
MEYHTMGQIISMFDCLPFPPQQQLTTFLYCRPLNSQMLASNSNGHGPFQGITPSQQVADERYPNIRVRPESPASPPNSVQTKGAAHKLPSEEVNDDNHKHGEGPDHGSDVAPVTERSGNLTKKVYNRVKRTVVALARKIRIRRVTEKNVQNSVFTATKNLSPDPVTQLLFNDAAAAKADDDQICFQPDPRDRTIPILDEDQQEYVLDLVNAIKNNGNVVEKTNNASFIKRWSDQATYYTEESFNKLAWYIVVSCLISGSISVQQVLICVADLYYQPSSERLDGSYLRRLHDGQHQGYREPDLPGEDGHHNRAPFSAYCYFCSHISVNHIIDLETHLRRYAQG